MIVINKERKKNSGLRCSFEKVWFIFSILLLMPDIKYDDGRRMEKLECKIKDRHEMTREKKLIEHEFIFNETFKIIFLKCMQMIEIWSYWKISKKLRNSHGENKKDSVIYYLRNASCT